MIIKKILQISLLILSLRLGAQGVSGIYKTSDLLKRIDSNDTTYVVNFWATWCKPCIQELPAFDSLTSAHRKEKFKVLLVSLDFKDELEKRVNPFLKKANIQSDCVLLDEVNGNDYIDLISKSWTGAIPATLFKKGKIHTFAEKKFRYKDLNETIEEMSK